MVPYIFTIVLHIRKPPHSTFINYKVPTHAIPQLPGRSINKPSVPSRDAMSDEVIPPTHPFSPPHPPTLTPPGRHPPRTPPRSLPPQQRLPPNRNPLRPPHPNRHRPPAQHRHRRPGQLLPAHRRQLRQLRRSGHVARSGGGGGGSGG